MRITAISDIHGSLIDIEKTDLLLIAGDWSPLNLQNSISGMKDWIKSDLIPWFKSIPADKIIFIAGNHDFICDPHYFEYCFEYDMVRESFYTDFLKKELKKEGLLDKVEYLHNRSTHYKGYTIYGCPNVEGMTGWAFSNADFWCSYDRITKCDILLTHQAPFYKNIATIETEHGQIEYGSPLLMMAIKRVSPSYLFCGHIHGGDHNKVVYKTKKKYVEMYNCAIKDETYKVYYKPQVVDVPDR